MNTDVTVHYNTLKRKLKIKYRGCQQNLYRSVDVFPEDVLSSVSRKFESVGAKTTDVSISIQIDSEDVEDKILL